MKPAEFRSIMEDNVDPKYRDFSINIANSPLELLGVRMPVLRATAKQICKGDWREFIAEPAEYYEQCAVKALVIGTAKMDNEERLKLTREFIPEIKDWAVNDTFCSAWKVKKGQEKPLWDLCVELLDSKEEFPMRVGAVMMMDKFIDDEHIDTMLALLTRKTESTGYYWDMGCAWALSFCYIKYPDKTEEKIFEGNLSPTILKMTVYKVRDSFRVPEERKAALKKRYKDFTEQRA